MQREEEQLRERRRGKACPPSHLAQLCGRHRGGKKGGTRERGGRQREKESERERERERERPRRRGGGESGGSKEEKHSQHNIVYKSDDQPKLARIILSLALLSAGPSPKRPTSKFHPCIMKKLMMTKDNSNKFTMMNLHIGSFSSLRRCFT